MLIRLFIVSIILICSNISLCQSDKTDYTNPDRENGILKGKIIDNETEAPVEGAVVEILRTKFRSQRLDMNRW